MSVADPLRVSYLSLVCLFAAGVPALGDATVWTNGKGLGGATVRLTGADGMTETREIQGVGGFEWVTSTDNTAAVNLSWREQQDWHWQISLWGYAIRPGASFGGTASIALISSLDLFGQFDPPGNNGSSFRLIASTFAVSLSQRNQADVHYALLGVHPNAIPQGFLGTADDLVAASVITSDQILTQFSASFPLFDTFDELVPLGQVYDLDNLTLLAWVHGRCIESCIIPAVSNWGLAVMVLLMLSAATIVIKRRTVLRSSDARA